MNIFNVFIIQPIFNLLFLIYSIIPGGDFGVTIVIFTLIVRFAMWPLVKKQLHQTKAMQKIQPELARIKRESKGDRQVESLKMMELYKKHDIHPFRSMGVLFIQLPIFIALYQVIRIFSMNRDQIATYTYEFLKGIGPIKDLIANPNNFNQKFLGFIDLTKHAFNSNPTSINIFVLLLAIAAAITQYVMSRQITPKQAKKRKLRDIMREAADGKEADQSELNAIMTSQMTNFLPVMMFFIMINLPGALVLYYTTSNLIAVLQQNHVLKDDAEEMIEMADKIEAPQPHKKATAKARAREAKEANIIRITAKDTSPRDGKKRRK